MLGRYSVSICALTSDGILVLPVLLGASRAHASPLLLERVARASARRRVLRNDARARLRAPAAGSVARGPLGPRRYDAMANWKGTNGIQLSLTIVSLLGEGFATKERI